MPFLRFWSGVGGIPATDYVGDGVQYTDMEDEVYPRSIYLVHKRLKTEYSKPPVYITENGASFKDTVVDGRVDDPQRITYLGRYLGEVPHTPHDGCDVRGYFVWSLLDNLERSFGFQKCHSVVYVVFETGRRIPMTLA